uniref:Uncharacterized protein n=1 Tax=Arion vulgaris TaxID=1028688 RepID=A0A0B7BMI7_9EUPU
MGWLHSFSQFCLQWKTFKGIFCHLFLAQENLTSGAQTHAKERYSKKDKVIRRIYMKQNFNGISC